MNKLFTCLLAGALVLCGGLSARAAFPDKPLNIVVNYAAGGTADISVRMMAPYLEKVFGQPVVVTNKGGGGGVPGLNSVLSAKPDGYTICAPAAPAFTASIFLKNKAYDFNEMSFVGTYMVVDRLLLARADKPYKTWQEFLAYARANPGRVSVGSGAMQQAMECLKAIAFKEGLDMNFVMYKSGGEASSDLIGGHIDVCDLGVGTAGYQAARKGDLNILANIGSSAVPDFPNVPRLHADLGYPFFCAATYSFVLPKGTPEDVRKAWEDALAKVLANPELKAVMTKAGFAPDFMDGAATRKFCEEQDRMIPELLEFNKQIRK